MNCPECGKFLQIGYRCTYNNVQMCIPCAYWLSAPDSPARKSFELNYPELREEVQRS